MGTVTVRAQGDATQEFALPILDNIWLSLNENDSHGWTCLDMEQEVWPGRRKCQ